MSLNKETKPNATPTLAQTEENQYKIMGKNTTTI